jgi:hypothetical protein
MNVRGNWRVVETPGYNMAGPGSYILFADNRGDGSPEGEICLEGGDDIPFITRRSGTSSTAC